MFGSVRARTAAASVLVAGAGVGAPRLAGPGLPPRPPRAGPHDPFRVVAITTAAPAQGFTVYTATELELVAQSDDALVRLLVRGGPPFLALVALVSWLIADRALRRVEGIRGKVAGITAEA